MICQLTIHNHSLTRRYVAFAAEMARNKDPAIKPTLQTLNEHRAGSEDNQQI
jgi:hypothetical protein